MQTILVPTDFSVTARNAALYAIQLAEDLGIPKVILYHAYQLPVSVDPMMPTMQMMDIREIKQLADTELDKFLSEVKSAIVSEVALEAVNEFNVLDVGIEQIVEDRNARFVIMGITGGNKMEEVLVGSNTTTIARKSKVPVIIIPSECKYTPIEEIVLACDFKKVAETTPVQPIKSLLDETKAKLFILNVTEGGKGITPDVSHESLLIETLFQQYQPSYHFLEGDDFTEVINDFSSKHEIDLIITIPKKHGLFDKLFRRNHTKLLAFHSHVPLMVVHE